MIKALPIRSNSADSVITRHPNQMWLIRRMCHIFIDLFCTLAIDNSLPGAVQYKRDKWLAKFKFHNKNRTLKIPQLRNISYTEVYFSLNYSMFPKSPLDIYHIKPNCHQYNVKPHCEINQLWSPMSMSHFRADEMLSYCAGLKLL